MVQPAALKILLRLAHKIYEKIRAKKKITALEI